MDKALRQQLGMTGNDFLGDFQEMLDHYSKSTVQAWNIDLNTVARDQLKLMEFLKSLYGEKHERGILLITLHLLGVIMALREMEGKPKEKPPG